MFIILFMFIFFILVLNINVLVFFMVLKKIGVIFELMYILLFCLLGIFGKFLLKNYNIELVVDLCDELVLIILLINVMGYFLFLIFFICVIGFLILGFFGFKFLWGIL